MRKIEGFVYKQIANMGATKYEIERTVDACARFKGDFTDDCVFKSNKQLTKETINNLLRMRLIRFDETEGKYVKN